MEWLSCAKLDGFPSRKGEEQETGKSTHGVHRDKEKVETEN